MNPSRKYPDADLCRTAFLCKSLHKCLAADAISCPHSMSFGNGFFCQHQDRELFQDEKAEKNLEKSSTI